MQISRYKACPEPYMVQGFLFSMNMPPKEQKAFSSTDFYLIMAMVIWGSDYTMAKFALREMTPLSFAAVRTLLSTLALLPFFLKWEKKWSVSRKDFFLLVVLALLGTFLNRICWSFGLASTTASNSALIMSTSPIFVLIVSAFLLRTEVNLRSALGIIVAFGGITLVIKGDWKGWEIGSQTLRGDLLVLAAAASWSLFTVLAKHLLKDHSSIKVTAYVMIISTFLFLPFIPNEKPGGLWGISGLAWFGVVYVAVMGNSLAYSLWVMGIKKMGPLRTILYQYLSPITAILFAIPLLNETLLPSQLWGAAIVFAGIFLARS